MGSFRYTQELFSHVFGRVCVPLFFAISGFLFFSGRKMTWPLLSYKWRARVRSLLVPYLIWNAIIFLLVFLGQSFAPTRAYFSGRVFEAGSLDWFSFLDAFIGFREGPINNPLWFLRDLIILSLLAPVFYNLVKVTQGWILAPLFLWLFGFFQIGDPFIAKQGIAFYCLGIWAAGKNFKWMNGLHAFLASALLVIYLIVSCVIAYLKIESSVPLYLHYGTITLGVLTIVIAAHRFIPEGFVGEKVKWLSASAYFIFLAHGHLLTLFKKVFVALLAPIGSVDCFAMYALSPLLTIMSLLVVYFLLSRYAAASLVWLTGTSAVGSSDAVAAK